MLKLSNKSKRALAHVPHNWRGEMLLNPIGFSHQPTALQLTLRGTTNRCVPAVRAHRVYKVISNHSGLFTRTGG